jgi:hypothetical protein
MNYIHFHLSIITRNFIQARASSVTEEHGALRHILCRGPFSATFAALLKIFFRRPPPRRQTNFSGHTTIFPKDENFFPLTPTMFIATVDVYLLKYRITALI